MDVTLVLLVLALAAASYVTLRRKEKAKERQNVPDTPATTYLGFPSRQVAELCANRLSSGSFYVPCAYCSGKKFKYDVLGLSQQTVEPRQEVATIVLACSNCATMRLVSPISLGVAELDENDQLVWLTDEQAE